MTAIVAPSITTSSMTTTVDAAATSSFANIKSPEEASSERKRVFEEKRRMVLGLSLLSTLGTISLSLLLELVLCRRRGVD
jgi:hypothetical protein